MTHDTPSQPLYLGAAGFTQQAPRAPLTQLPPLSLYIHIPWCVRKCPYCDFNSHTASPVLPEEEYVDALLADLDQDLHAVYGRELSSIFFGGGTPSLFSAQALGRIHNGDEAVRAAGMARQAGFDNFNLDLMHGLPDQSLEDALSDLRQAIALKPTHLSWYQLTLEPNTVFWNKPPDLPEDDTLWDIQEAGQALLAEHGYAQYEVSAYAQPGRPARHNLNYWSFGDFIGIGAGAHGKLSHPDGRIVRTWKTRLPKDYLNPAKNFQAGEKTLTAEELPFEFLMNALRLTDGVDSSLYPQRTGLPLESLNEGRQAAEQSGLLQVEPTRLAATARGQLFLNDLLQHFLI